MQTKSTNVIKKMIVDDQLPIRIDHSLIFKKKLDKLYVFNKSITTNMRKRARYKWRLDNLTTANTTNTEKSLLIQTYFVFSIYFIFNIKDAHMNT